jgi:hypothetical protein
MARAPNEEERRLGHLALSHPHTADETIEGAFSVDGPAHSPLVTSEPGRRVVDLAAERRRRLLRDLGLEPAPVCSGCCTCWSPQPLGGCST